MSRTSSTSRTALERTGSARRSSRSTGPNCWPGSTAGRRGSAGDYGDRLIPELVADGGRSNTACEGYWRDVGTINSYHRAHMELVGERPAAATRRPDVAAADGLNRRRPGTRRNRCRGRHGRCSARASVVDGVVEDSVLGRNAVVEAGRGRAGQRGTRRR